MYYLNRMNKIITFLKKYNKFFAILFIIALFFLIIINKDKKTVNIEPSPTPINVAEYKDLTPGVSTKDEVFSKMGTALNVKIEDTKETYEYLSSNPNFNTEVVIFNDKLSYIKVVYTIKDNVKYEDFINKYGNPEKVLYGPDYYVGYLLNAYPTKGIAFLYHNKSYNVREAWYFEPTNLDVFINDFALGYSDKIKIVQ